MSDFYTLATPGPPAVSLVDAKSYLKLPKDVHPDDGLVKLLTEQASENAETFTGRDLRVNTWELLRDTFDTRMCLNRDPVDSITSVQRKVDGNFLTVSASVYYLKKSQQFSEVLLDEDQEWPDDMDEIEHTVKVTFATVAHSRLAEARAAILKHVAYLYENRGDCDPLSNSGGFVLSGAADALMRMRIARV